jgi:hypothetical protein
MKTNILKAIFNLIGSKNNNLKNIYRGSNRANIMGEALEYYIKDLFCGSLNEKNMGIKDKIYSKHFSYIGNQNNPPDFIISEGDAAEVKKIEGIGGIALNSSYPKSKLHSGSSMITQTCRDCEKWETKDVIYSIGTISGGTLKLLWMVYGDCYAADSEVYERVRNKISKGVNELPGVEFSETDELGRVNKVDPLGITYLRIRGMWGIEHPNKVFNYVTKYDRNKKFSLFALMRDTKYNSLPKVDREAIEVIKDKSFSISSIEIKDPNNPAIFIPAKLIQFSMG